MSNFKKVGVVFSVLMNIILAVLLILDPEEGYLVVIIVLATALVVFGFRNIWFYITMARHMVGGQVSLYLGLIMFDLGIVTLGLPNVPKIYMVLYLVIVHGLAGVFAILRVNEARKNGGVWKLTFAGGIINIAVALICLIFIRNTVVTVWVFAAGLINSSVISLISTFKKSEIVYIQ